MKKFLIILYLLSSSVILRAGGFQANALGAKALGLGGAFTAYNKDASAAYYNPGAVALLDSGRYISLGATILMPRTSFRGTATGLVFEMEEQNLFPAYLYVATPISGKFYASLSVNSPFMVANKWADNWEGRSVSQELKMNTYYIQPGLAYRLNNNFSFGAAVVYGISDILLRRNIGESNTDMKLEGNASGFGFNAGIFGKLQDELAFGITYRSAIEFKYDGDATFTNMPSQLTSQYQSQEFTSGLKMPGTLSVGLTNRINSKVVASFEFNLTSWSVYDSLNVDFANNATTDARAGRRYEDAMAFRAGAEIQVLEKMNIRGGVYYDETPVRDEFISPDLPDGSRLGLTAGISYQIGDKFEVDAAYVFEKASERNSQESIGNTKILNIGGTYRSVTTGFGLGLNYKF